jgi:hypothetical protein
VSFYEVTGSIYRPSGLVAAGGVLVGEREVQWPARRCGYFSRCGQPSNFHRLRSCVHDLVPEAVCGSVGSVKEVWSSLLVRPTLGPLVIRFGSGSSG